MRDGRVASTICGVRELKAAPFSTDDPEATRQYRPG